MFYDDEPLDDPSQDRLGFRSFAKNLANAILQVDDSKGLVIGIHGPWGSGKTTLRNFVVAFLRESADPPLIVPFNAWWFTGREELLKGFFATLSHALTDKRFPATVNESFTRIGITIGAEFPRNAQTAGSHMGRSESNFSRGDFAGLKREKAELEKQLAASKQKIVFTVDDIDRVTEDELRQIFRLITEVADLPYVTYLLTFDKEVVASALNGENSYLGSDYLEKVVQVPFQLPSYDKDYFRSVFLDEFDKLLKHLPDDAVSAEYFRDVYNHGIEPFLTNPRRLFRLLNTLVVNLPSVSQEVDPIDMLAIETMRLYCPTSYEQITKLPHRFVSDINFHLDNVEKEKESMEAILDGIPFDQKPAATALLVRLFPRVAKALGVRSNSARMRSKKQESLGIHNQDRFPIYFQFSIPGWGVSVEETTAILELLARETEFSSAMERLKYSKRPNGTTRLSSFLDRIPDLIESLPDHQVKLLVSFLLKHGESLMVEDDFAQNRLGMPFGNEMSVQRSIFSALRRLPAKERYRILHKSIPESASLCTVAQVVYTLGRAHGKYQGDRSNSEPLVTKRELETLESDALKLIKSRAEEMTLISAKELKLVLMCWRYWEDLDAVKHWIEESTKTDGGLLQLLKNFFGTSAIRSDSLQWHIGDLSELKKRAEKFLKKKLTHSQRRAVEIFLDRDRNAKGLTWD